MNDAQGRLPRPRRTQRDRPAPRVQLAREVAFTVIRATTADDAYANLLLPKEIVRAGLSTADAALATELTYGTLRRRGTYDAMIEIASGRQIDEIDPPVLDALRLGVHQLLATRVAPHAAVNESVALASLSAGKQAAGFANAVLRRVSRQTAEEWDAALADAARSDDELLAMRSSHPVWIIRGMRRALKAEGRSDELEDLLEADNASPSVTLVSLPGLAETAEPRTPYSPVGSRAAAGDPERIVRASGGAIRVQDEGSQLVALALSRVGNAAAGERWLDLCAGPGGKTALLAAEARGVGATLEANELVPARAGLVRRALEALPEEITVHERDGRDFAEAHPDTFDRILVDAPCTGLGALRRRPEARWRKSASDIAQLTMLQAELLTAAIGALKPGGIVAYVTCSPHLAETVGVVNEVRDKVANISLMDAREAIRDVSRSEIDIAEREDGLPVAQLWPHRHQTDGMFLALIRKE
ncbi:RsmB/NOP family class I SAM-dependent RNA methyltransferase [Microbacterium amylolyticum]|uniref:16S rRNA (Cytosine967-C5)-methyltransferase n=1 Tax=Microbacterium amylolyticum TaxID=936337 RepID=A0ABS4ZE47_9MICO|nr:transcription antitermination factor NusB [Microbacterium amylolyticum]MBP2435550.1 16S rRNA (cytosine967-C5)-methyltransferase [Microbacterium amylolyticum]